MRQTLTDDFWELHKNKNCSFPLIMKIYNKRELQNITINHSADIDYKDFLNIYRNVQVNHILF